jgi:2-polyprenyl-3-methyl-5-hydroxy-6-metoxy-1,4-benzoquinol methylase
VESAELIAILREVRERVRARNPETAADIDIALPDLMPLVHARDSAMGKVAAIGTVNPRSGGLLNALVQAWKRLLARVLDWHVREQVEFNRNVMIYCDTVIEALRETNRALTEMGSRIAIEKLGSEIKETNLAIAELSDRLANEARQRDELAGRLEAGAGQLKTEFEDVRTEFGDIRKHWAEWRVGWEYKVSQNEIQFLRSVADLQGAFQHRVTLMEASHRDLMREHNADFHAALERHGAEIQKRLWADLEKMRGEIEKVVNGELRIVRQRMQISTAQPSGRPAGLAPAEETPPQSPPHKGAISALDYARFAERFRGSEETVKAKQAMYLPYFKDRTDILDIGCGRGEFLETMRAAGAAARGIDLSEESVAVCRLKGLSAEVADVFPYLAALPEGTLDGIFCAQVVEHLPPERLPELIHLCARALSRQGLIAIETPNPECLAIFATHFYLDPTHERPVPYPLMTFYLEECGFSEIEMHRLSPAVEELPALSSLPEDFRNGFFGALDYAIIGKKL